MPGLLRSVPLLAQSDRADCLPACVEMVLASFGQRVERDWLKRVLETTPLGTPGFKLLNLRAYNYDVVYAAAMNERPLTEALSNNVPPIALVYTTGLSYWTRETAHAVVVVEFGDRVALHDPAFPEQPQVVLRDAFMLAWSDFDYLYAVISPT